MDHKKYAEAADEADRNFAAAHPAFSKWWAHHPHKDPLPKFAVPARVAWQCACYRNEYEARVQ